VQFSVFFSPDILRNQRRSGHKRICTHYTPPLSLSLSIFLSLSLPLFLSLSLSLSHWVSTRGNIVATYGKQNGTTERDERTPARSAIRLPRSPGRPWSASWRFSPDGHATRQRSVIAPLYGLSRALQSWVFVRTPPPPPAEVEQGTWRSA